MVKKKMYHELIAGIIAMTVPAILEYSLQTLVNYTDYIMVGSYGPSASATIGLTNEVTWLLKAGINALGIGVLAFVARQVGAGKKEKLAEAVFQAYVLAFLIGLGTMLIALFISPFLTIWLGASSDIQKPASVYFSIVSVPEIFFAFNVIAGNIRKATRDMKTPLLVNGLVNLVNIILNWFLIYPSKDFQIGAGLHLRIERAGLGVTGAAVATAIATFAGGILMVAANECHMETSVRKISHRLDTSIIGKYIAVGIPAFLTAIMTSGGRVIFTGMVARLGTVVYAAHTMAFTAESVFYIPVVGMSGAVAALSGNVRGENNLKKLNRQTGLICLILTIVMTFGALLMFVSAYDIIGILTGDKTVLRLAPRLLQIVALNEPFFGISVVMQNVFNGTGNTKPPLVVSTLTQWVFRVGGTFVFVILLRKGIEAAWYCMIADNIARAVLLTGWYVIYNRKLFGNSENTGALQQECRFISVC